MSNSDLDPKRLRFSERANMYRFEADNDERDCAPLAGGDGLTELDEGLYGPTPTVNPDEDLF